LSSAAGYAGPIGAIAVGEVLLLVVAEIDLSAGQVFLFAAWVEYWLLFAFSTVAVAAASAVAALAVVAAVVSVVRRRLVVTSAIRRALRELGVLPVTDFARAAAWLDRRLLGPAGGVLALGALVVAVALLVRR
jgi:ribose/xylose/arabinose/galactoside ABC-type transport system permease subunit